MPYDVLPFAMPRTLKSQPLGALEPTLPDMSAYGLLYFQIEITNTWYGNIQLKNRKQINNGGVMKLKNIILMATAGLLSQWAVAGDLTLSSKTIAPNATLTNEQVFKGFGCSGENVSPDLTWTPGPEGTKSYAVTVYDPDAPTGSGWWHWVVYDIPADVTALAKGAGVLDSEALPAGTKQARTDFGSHAFGGACPPAGDKPHRYVFTVFALKTETLGVPDDATAALIGFMINANTLGSSSFTAFYGR
ncbi:YbhB/YbcL family Raf kinase inhibitor-like protein [Halioxenophilus sp. WMMB6]|uniref:YbhB/YbcL family Raf kinase inhibitor-like protein n=1 Tax=Halioxenophilus sp. WMMB6 TaxID=3073815 RepID=UPI00295F285A|nr:YbhB/YbcL family Raf kinase inhibitor-like protein [Halioxenophilus sp. WMMB6]